MKESSVLIIGSGNAASFLCRSLHCAGVKIEGIIARNPERGKLLAAGAETQWKSSFVPPESEKTIIISAVKDSAAQELWQKCSFGGNLVLHTAGALSLKDLAPYARNCGVLYPLQTLSASRIIESVKVPFLIEANSKENLARLRQLAAALSPMVQECSSETRKKLHLAAVFANNFSNLCFQIAWELAEKAGVAPEILLPIIEESCAKLRHLSPAEAQTGPAVRWDENIMQKHLELLADMPEAAALYRQASAGIHRRKKQLQQFREQ